jgi:hypothetical protein
MGRKTEESSDKRILEGFERRRERQEIQFFKKERFKQ